MNTDDANGFELSSEFLQERIKQGEAGRISIQRLRKASPATDKWRVKNVDQADEFEAFGFADLLLR